MRIRVIGSVLFLLLVFAAGVALVLPGAGITAADAWAALLGQDDGLARTIVTQWRAPRVFAAIVVGAGLGVAGLLFQSLTRNPLGSPDVIGFSTGAYTGVICAIYLGYSGFYTQALGALVGGCAAAAVVLLFSLRSRVEGLRIIIVGIGVAAMLSSFNRWLITRGDLETMMSAASWGAGSLNGIRWTLVAPAAVILLVCVAAALPLRRPLDILALGDDTATGLGLPVNAFKLLLLAAGIVLVSVSTAVAGPVSFLALAAPHIAQALTRSARHPVATSALVGALVLVLADVAAQRLFHPVQLPVGLVTLVIGGAYLLLLIARSTNMAPNKAPNKARSAQ